eukprot:Gb_03618 [translate_table: standard]
MFIPNICIFKLVFPVLLIYILKDVLEPAIIFFKNRIFGAQIKRPLL